MYEIIKLNIDETGVKVENEGVMIATKSCVVKKVEPKYILLDGPFWIMMREKGKQEYFLAHITEPVDK